MEARLGSISERLMGLLRGGFWKPPQPTEGSETRISYPPDLYRMQALPKDVCKWPRPTPREGEPIHSIVLEPSTDGDLDNAATGTYWEELTSLPNVDMGLYAEEPVVVQGQAPEMEVAWACIDRGHTLVTASTKTVSQHRKEIEM